MQPLNDRVLIKVDEALKKSEGGLFIPEAFRETTQTGVVIRIGESCEAAIEPGDRVMYHKYAGVLVSIDGADHLVVKTEDILATIEEAPHVDE